MDSCIYILKNKINGKIYVGQTVVLKQRIHYHRYYGKNPKTGSHSVIGRAIKKYGIRGEIQNYKGWNIRREECDIHA